MIYKVYIFKSYSRLKTKHLILTIDEEYWETVDLIVLQYFKYRALPK